MLHYTAVHCTGLRSKQLHCSAQLYTALHCITVNHRAAWGWERGCTCTSVLCCVVLDPQCTVCTSSLPTSNSLSMICKNKLSLCKKQTKNKNNISQNTAVYLRKPQTVERWRNVCCFIVTIIWLSSAAELQPEHLLSNVCVKVSEPLYLLPLQ